MKWRKRLTSLYSSERTERESINQKSVIVLECVKKKEKRKRKTREDVKDPDLSESVEDEEN